MKLTGLLPLYKSMRSQGIERTKFRYQHNHLLFDCFFFIDTVPEPFELVLGCIGHDFAIYVKVLKGFEIRTYIEPEEAFRALTKALKQGKGSEHVFSAKEFFEEFNRAIPQHAQPDAVPTPQDVARIYPDIEDALKVHFCGWLDNNKAATTVQPKNLEKTRRYFGQRIFEMAKKRNLSSKWTDDPDKAIRFHEP